jgi:hypothetical protein
VRKERDVAAQQLKPGNEAVRAVGYLGRCFTVWTAVPKYIPIRAALANIHRALSFIVAVIPLGQVRFDLRLLVQSHQRAGLPGALPRAGQHRRKPDLMERWFELTRLVFTMRGQGKLRATGVLARKRPFGLAVANVEKP